MSLWLGLAPRGATLVVPVVTLALARLDLARRFFTHLPCLRT